MKRGETDLSEVFTALLSFHFSPLSTLLFLLLSASSALSSLHLYALFPLFNSVLSPLSFNLPVMFPLLFSSLLFSSLLFCSINDLPVIVIYFDDLFSSLSGENYSVHTYSLSLLLSLSLSLSLTDTHTFLCLYTVRVYLHCHPQLIACASPHPATQRGRKAMVQSRTMAASTVQWSRLSVWGPSVSHLLSIWPANRDWWCSRATLGSTLQCDLFVSSALGNDCSAVIHHHNRGKDVNDRVEAWTYVCLRAHAHVYHISINA